jgi:hypothetical protein
MMKKFTKKNKYGLLLIVPGAILGYLYWYYIGCNSGTCPITSVWYNSALWGAVMGYLVGNMVDDSRKKKAAQKKEFESQNQELSV